MPTYEGIEFDLKKLEHFCEEERIKRLYLFGSLISGKFRKGRSDIDLLADMHENHFSNLERRMGMEETLSKIIGYPKIDLKYLVEVALDSRDEFIPQLTRLC